MASFMTLVGAVETLLATPGVAAVLQMNSPTRERAFEAYVFALVVRAVRQAGGSVVLTGIRSGADPNPHVFRGGPGQMSSRAQDFVYAKCMLGERSFEVHVDVQYEGTSGAMSPSRSYLQQPMTQVRGITVLHTTADAARISGVACSFPKKCRDWLQHRDSSRIVDSSASVPLARERRMVARDLGRADWRAPSQTLDALPHCGDGFLSDNVALRPARCRSTLAPPRAHRRLRLIEHVAGNDRSVHAATRRARRETARGPPRRVRARPGLRQGASPMCVRTAARATGRGVPPTVAEGNWGVGDCASPSSGS